MTLEKLIQRIEEEARKEKEEIIKEAEKKAEEIIEEAREKAEEEAEKIIEKAKKEAERIKEKIIASARRKARMYVTDAKEELINKCYEMIKEKLKKLDSKTYNKILEKMLQDALKEIKDGYIISTRKEDEEIARKYGLEIRGKADRIGGIILKSKDGSKEIDLTFDFLLERKKQEIRIMIARELFEK